MQERKNDGTLSLNVKKLLILHLLWKANRILQYGSLFFIMRLILVRILLGCKKNDVIPKFLRFKLANRDTLIILMCTGSAKSDC